MDNRTIIKYENLLMRIHNQFDSHDLSELSELIAYLVKNERTGHAAAVLRLAVFYQPEVPELWTKLGDIQVLDAKLKESRASCQEAARLINNRLHVTDYSRRQKTERLPLPAPFFAEAVFVT